MVKSMLVANQRFIFLILAAFPNRISFQINKPPYRLVFTGSGLLVSQMRRGIDGGAIRGTTDVFLYVYETPYSQEFGGREL